MAAIDAYRSEHLMPVLRGRVGLTGVGTSGTVHEGTLAVFIDIEPFGRLREYVESVAELMSHQRSPTVQICAGATIVTLNGAP